MNTKEIFSILENNLLKGDIEKSSQLLLPEFNYDIHNKSGETPLITAIKKRSFIFVKKILECGADINFPDSKGKTPLIHAYTNTQLSEITSFLISKKANPEISLENNLLIRAVQLSDEKTVKLLLETYPEIDLNVKIGGVLPLMLECCGYYENITKMLCLATKNIDQIDIFIEQISVIKNPALLESVQDTLKLLESLKLNFKLEDTLASKPLEKKLKL